MQEDTRNIRRVALYGRVSTEEQREGQTIDSQITELERFAGTQQWIVVGTYRDDGWSGSLLARPQLDRLRDDASKGLFEAAVINDVDRLARDVTHLGIIKRDLERHGIRVIFRKLPGEQSPTQNLLVNILGSFAEFERELIADRTRRGRRHKVEVRKEHIGAIPPYGYRYISKQSSGEKVGHLEVLAEEAAVVRQMYSWVAYESLSSHAVVLRLNSTRTRPRKGGSQWARSSVLRILRSEVYAGVWHYNKHRGSEPRNRSANVYRRSLKTSNRLRPREEWMPLALPDHLRIVDVALWQRVQEQLNRNTSFSSRNAKHDYLLKGLVRCGACNATYVGEPCHGRFAYRCLKRCKGYGSIKEQFLNDAVWQATQNALQNPEVILKGVKESLNNRHSLAAQDTSVEITRALSRLDSEEARLVEAYRLEILSAEQLQRELTALKERRNRLTSICSKGPANVLDNATTERSIEEYCQVASQRIKELDLQQRKLVLRRLLKQVIFEGNRVRIIGRISFLQTSRNANAAVIDPSTPSAGEIATTSSEHYGHNPVLIDSTGLSVGEIVFEFAWKIEKDLSAARAASLVNLAKAKAALQASRVARKGHLFGQNARD